MPLGSGGGQLEVLHGRVWLTRAGDLDDYVVESGASFAVPASGQTLVEAWDGGRPALVAWQPTPLADRVRAVLRSVFGRCWDIVDPARRIGVGAAAALVALLAGLLLFGPLSESRTRSLLAPTTVLHNSAGARTSIGLDAGTRTGSANDVSAALRERARIAAQEARRRPAGPA
ncbi:MAG: DUF2917 domain-containing protein [Pseudomonadota bacterium]|nr:DUF2917 domain-containing protein [Pseudomonadota bacterium]